jgi:hypothetical protein
MRQYHGIPSILHGTKNICSKYVAVIHGYGHIPINAHATPYFTFRNRHVVAPFAKKDGEAFHPT